MCDVCPLGPNGFIRDKTKPWAPVPGEFHVNAKYVAVAEVPGNEEEREGRPLVGRSGHAWNVYLGMTGHYRPEVDLLNALCCKPPGDASGAVERISNMILKARRNLEAKYVSEGLKKGEARQLAEQRVPHPLVCCKPRLLKELTPYRNILTLGSSSTRTVLDTASSIFALRGGPKEVPSRNPDGTEGPPRRVMPTFHPAFVMRAQGWAHTFVSDLGKAFRFFTDTMNWIDPDMLLQPNPDQLREWLAVPSPFWAYDLETDAIEPLLANVRCVAIATPDLGVNGRAWRDGPVGTKSRAVGITILGRDGVSRQYPDGERLGIEEILRQWFLDGSRPKIGHNIVTYDNPVTRRWLGLKPLGTTDTILLTRMRSPESPKALGVIGTELTDVNAWKNDFDGRKIAVDAATDLELVTYCMKDACVNARIFVPLVDACESRQQLGLLPEVLKPAGWLKDKPWTLLDLDHERQEMCANLHENGVYVDEEARAKFEKFYMGSVVQRYKNLLGFASKFGLKVAPLEEVMETVPEDDEDDEWGIDEPEEEKPKKRPKSAGFNPGSANQVRDLLYDGWRLTIPPFMEERDFHTKSGMPSTADKVLRAHLAAGKLTEDQADFLKELRLYRREKNKVLGTLLVPLRRKSADSEHGLVWDDGRVRSSWSEAITSVARLSSSNPNLQNVSSRKGLGHLRKIFAAPPGYVLVGADLNQAHVRVCANYWRISRLLRCFEEGIDPHNMLALDVFGDDFKNASGWGPEGFSLKIKPKEGDAKDQREVIKTFRYACAKRGTLVAVLPGHGKPIEEIEPGKDWTWSHDGRRSTATRIVQKTCVGMRDCVAVTLHDGGGQPKSVVFTSDHRFMLRDGSYAHARDLEQYDSLMSAPWSPDVRVERVESAGEHEVWDIAVEHEASNFAIGAGVFVHNSIYGADKSVIYQVVTSTEGEGGHLPYLHYDPRQIALFHKRWLRAEPEWEYAWARMLAMFGKNGFMDEPILGRRSGALSGGKKNEVINNPILGAEVALISLAEVGLRAAFPHQHWGPGTGLIHQEHDHVSAQVPEHLAEWAKGVFRECMNFTIPGWPVPITSTPKVGRTLYDV